jgi:oligopeptide/dipeptide ABC transporter ATP-binding protein
MNLLLELQNEMGVSYLFIAHDLAAVRHLSDRIAVMYLGKIVEEGKSETLTSRPRHPYTQALLASVPIADPNARHRTRMNLVGEVPSPSNPPTGCRFHTRCPYVKDICRTLEPKLAPTNQNNSLSRVACHFPLS